jgi:predicted amidophosphoribosyltransferase
VKLELLAVDRKRPNGRRPICKACDSARSLERYRRTHPPVTRHCSECGLELEGRHRVTCGSAKCREARFKRLQPESYAAREAAKVERRRARRQGGE